MGDFKPSNEQDLLHPDGLYYGVNAMPQNVIVIDLFNADNPNGLILGVSGRGFMFRNGMPGADYLSLDELCEWMDALLGKYVCRFRPIRITSRNLLGIHIFE